MTRTETIEFIRALNGSIDVKYLQSLSPEELYSYLVHLKAVRIKQLNDQRRFEPVESHS